MIKKLLFNLGWWLVKKNCEHTNHEGESRIKEVGERDYQERCVKCFCYICKSTFYKEI